jgi:two-component sensor histidine kinase
MISALIAALGATGCLWLFGEFYFRAHLAVSEQAGLENVRSRLDLFDLVLSRAERDLLAPGKAALLGLGKRFPTAAHAARLSPQELTSLAAEFGVGEVYFINTDGVVFASSFEPDIGLDLFSLGARFTSSLKKLYGSGVVGDQRLTNSTRTGVLSVYQYYSPPGADLIIEVSSRIDSALRNLYSEYDYRELVKLAFGEKSSDSIFKASVRLVDLVGESGGMYWSLLEVGMRRSEYADLIDLARKNLPARSTEGWIETVAFPVPLPTLDTTVVHDRRFAIIEIDRKPLMHYRHLVFYALAFSCALAFVVSALLANRRFARLVVARVEGLEQAMIRVGEDGAPFDFPDAGNDEISSIARGVEKLVARGCERAVEREALNARLSAEIEARSKREAELARALAEQHVLMREIHHRVKNNMQITLSLVGLQSGLSTEECAVRALEATRTRLYAMSLVMERLYARVDVDHLPLDDFLREICYYLDGVHRRPGFFAKIRTDGAGLNLSAASAVPVGLMVGELVNNSLLHAFSGRGTGLIEVSASAGENGGFGLIVSDDGIGGSLQEGVGMNIVRALASQLGASLSVEVEGGRTTRIIVPRGAASPPVT